MKLEQLYKRLGYTFKNKQLLETALTHRSQSDITDNERLEFLGDAILNFVIAEHLYNKPSNLSEGKLTRFRSALVKRDTLTKLAQELDLGPHLLLGQGELRSGGRKRASILSNAMEAVIGAIYLDAGIAICRQRILDWLKNQINDVLEAKYICKDPKSRLQEYLQGYRHPLPVYKIISIKGKTHSQTFHVSCSVPDQNGKTILTTGEGASRSKAEQAAALACLKAIEATA